MSVGLQDAAFALSVPEVGQPGRTVTGNEQRAALFSLTTGISEKDAARNKKLFGSNWHHQEVVRRTITLLSSLRFLTTDLI